MKRILITGATSGIGKATFELATANGHTVFLTGRNEEALINLVKDRPNAFYFKTDITKIEDVILMEREVKNKITGIDVLINNAGIGIFDNLQDGKLEDWNTMIDVNIKGLLNVLHTFLPNLIKENGHIINLGSVASHHIFPNSGVYCATKHAVLAISEGIRADLSKKVRVTTISPGTVNTPFIDKTKNESLLKQFKPTFDIGMTPELVATQIINAIELPNNANISEIIIRPFYPSNNTN